MAGGALSQSTLSSGRRDPAHLAFARLYAHVAAGGGSAPVPQRQRRQSGTGQLARGQRLQSAERVVPSTFQYRQRAGAPVGGSLQGSVGPISARLLAWDE